MVYNYDRSKEAAKKANLYIIVTSLNTFSELQSLEYIRLHSDYFHEIQKKFTELRRNGVIFIYCLNVTLKKLC
ncbi:hypothetical protein BCR32DRAFT_281754 [Anaeromyces robustus]|uniref:Uncharacterized protein n=1 Tax=Anaeromyces robustus TaxID=1754192 RepID=A0A1Y1X031_9FUNG|nr:hypothetical protein BCR32DRAFT_281754 [Anaeromyces robustus]|eukprot:ORX79052.1 hypothetical protein BCR32DRAFT_281754 [Anaeromyces robustus]